MLRLKTNLNRLLFVLGLLLLWNLALLLPWPLSNLALLLGLPVTLLLPGLFIAFSLGARRLSAVTLAFAGGLSVLLLIFIALLANYLPQMVGVHRPLDTPTLFWLFNAGYVALAILAATRVPHKKNLVKFFGQLRRQDQLIIAATTLIPVLAALGAVSLNDAGSNFFSLSALTATTIIIPTTYLLRRRLHTASLFWVIATTTLGLLLASSLRSWYISGQDMQHEFQVFNLALQQGRWDIASYREPYNACLSITLLPVALHKLIHIDGTLVFKLIDQLIFIIAPLTVFLTSREFLGRGKAFIAAVLLIGLPTFSIDVPFISRQEIAFVFVTLAIGAIFIRTEPWLKRHRNALFVAMALGVVLSHYSTAYLFIGPLVLAYGSIQLFVLLNQKPNRMRRRLSRGNISTWTVLIICLCSYIWFGQVTKVGGDLQQKLASSVAKMGQLVKDPSIIIKTITSPNADSQQVSIRHYVDNTKVAAATSTADIQKNLTVVSSDLPATPVSKWIIFNLGLNAPQIVSTLYYGLATKLYLLFIAIGTFHLFRPSVREKLGKMPILYPIWCAATAVVLGSQLFLPGLAENYGITRAFMQAFLVLCLPMVFGVGVLVTKWKRFENGLLISLATGLFVLYSGFLPYITGGIHKQLSLQNSGQYYGTVYPQTPDLAAYSWMQDNLPAGSKINLADYAAVYAYYPQSTFDTTNAGIFPFQVKAGNYALLSESQTTDHMVYTFDNLIGLKIDPFVYDDADLLYSSGSVQLFRKNKN